MSWKNWPYWLKGGVIGVILIIVFFIIIVSISNTSKGCTSWENSPYYCISIIGASFLIAVVTGSRNMMFLYISTGITNIIIVFIVGSLIGLIYGKIKNRKESKELDV